MASQKSERTALGKITNNNTGIQLSWHCCHYYCNSACISKQIYKHLQHLWMRPNERGKKGIENNENTEQRERLRSPKK